MKRAKAILTSPAATVLAFLLAAGLLLFSTVGGARAALTYYSDTYASRMQLSDIGVTLLENGAEASGDALLGGMLAEDGQLTLNKPYAETLCVKNNGAINQYVRVSIYRYWVDADGNKRTDLDPGMIRLSPAAAGWQVDPDATTRERTVLYYDQLLPVGAETASFAETVAIDGAVAVQTDDAGGFLYNGAKFVLEIHVDAVQENNAQAAALSAWGRRVTVDEAAGTLRLG